jgi:hypothetical protein
MKGGRCRRDTPQLHQVYDQHSYRDEKRECLRLWELRLRGILEPKRLAEAEIHTS